MLVAFAHWLARLLKIEIAPAGAFAAASAATAEAAATTSATPPPNSVAEATAELVGRVSNLTACVASDVEQHSGSIHALSDELSGLQAADSTAVAAVIHKLLVANQEMENRLEQAEIKLQAHQRQLQTVASVARTDSLTGLLNRRSLDEQLTRSLAYFHRRGRPSVLMMLDIDYFKRFNDDHGHVVGDAVLKHVAGVLLAHCRETDVVARFGGEEFAVIFIGGTISNVRERAEEARAAIGKSELMLDGKRLRATASAGLTQISEHDNSVSLLGRADAALYAAKHNGRNCTFWNDGQRNLPLLGQANEELKPENSAPLAANPDEKEAAVELAAEQFADATFVSNIARRIAEWRRGGTTFCVVLARLDHAAAEALPADERAQHQAVHAIYKAAAGCLRDMDLTTRWLSDGLAMLLPGATASQAMRVARRLQSSIDGLAFEIDGRPVKLSMGLGLAEGIEGNDSYRVLCRAWQALQSAREAGSGSTFVHDGIKTRPVQAAVVSK